MGYKQRYNRICKLSYQACCKTTPVQVSSNPALLVICFDLLLNHINELNYYYFSSRPNRLTFWSRRSDKVRVDMDNRIIPNDQAFVVCKGDMILRKIAKNSKRFITKTKWERAGTYTMTGY